MVLGIFLSQKFTVQWSFSIFLILTGSLNQNYYISIYDRYIEIEIENSVHRSNELSK